MDDDQEADKKRRYQHNLQAYQDAMESSRRKAKAGDEEGAWEDTNYAARLFAQLYRDTPDTVHEDVLPTEVQVQEIRELIKRSEPLTVRACSPIQLTGSLVEISLLAIPEENTACPARRRKRRIYGRGTCQLRIACEDLLLEEKGPFDKISLAGLPIYWDSDTPRASTSHRGKLILRGIREGSVGRLRW